MGYVDIRVVDKTPKHSTYEQGFTVYKAIKNELSEGKKIRLSFYSISAVPSSFVNGLLNKLLEDIGTEGIKNTIEIVDSTNLNNDMLHRKFKLASSN